MFQTPVRTLLLIGLALLVFVFLLSLNWLLNEENGLKVQTIESDFVENDINNSEDFSNKFNDNGVDDDVKQSTDDVEFAFRGDQFRKHKNVDVAPNRVSWFETNNVAFLVFPSMLGPETIDVARERASAVQTTWAASIPRNRVFYLQWFEGGDVIGDTEQLLRVPSEFNQTFVTRVFWGVSEIQKKLKPNWIVKGDDVTYFLTKNLIRLLDDEQLDIHKPLMMGHLLQGPGMERPFLSGGAGYAMSQAVVELFSKLILEQDPCVQSEGGAEDVTVATCLSRHYEVKLDDESMRTDAIFHAFCPLTLLRLKGGVYNFPVEWYESYRKPFGGVITGKECCDPFTVSFHYVLPAQMRALHFTLHNRRVPPSADSVYFEPYYQQRDVLEPFLLQHIV